MKENYTYYQMPKFLFSEEYSLSPSAKILYSLMLDRMNLSLINGSDFTDEEGKTFILFSYKEAAKMLMCHKNTVTNYIGELKKAGLISVKRHSFTERRIYIHEIALSTTQKDGLDERDLRSSVNVKPCTNKNKYNKTEFNKTYKRREKEERPKPSYDIDAFTKKAFSNPMLLLEKKKAREKAEEAKSALAEKS